MIRSDAFCEQGRAPGADFWDGTAPYSRNGCQLELSFLPRRNRKFVCFDGPGFHALRSVDRVRAKWAYGWPHDAVD